MCPIVFGLERDDEVVGGDQRHPGAEAEVRRAIYQYKIIFSPHTIEPRPEDGLVLVRCLEGAWQVEVVHLARPGDQVDPLDPGRMDDLLGVGVFAAVDRGQRPRRVEPSGRERPPETLAQAELRVAVHQQDAFAQLAKRPSKMMAC